jgi:hypothetical protein
MPSDALMDSVNSGATETEITAVNTLLTTFHVAYKNFALYPPSHSILGTSLNNVKNQLKHFLGRFGDLRLFVGSDSLVYRDEEVYKGPQNEENMAVILYRDGIVWIEFQERIEDWEIQKFFSILNRYRTLQEEAEGDLATALWEVDFPSLTYEVTDAVLEEGGLIDFGGLAVGPQEAYDQGKGSGFAGATGRSQTDDDAEQGAGGDNGDDDDAGADGADDAEAPPVSATLTMDDDQLWQLTPEEKAHLKQEIENEEDWEDTEDVIDVLLFILQAQQTEADFGGVLAFIQDEFQEVILQAEYGVAYKMLTRLKAVAKAQQECNPWVVPLVEQLFTNISSPKMLEAVHQSGPQLASFDSYRLKELRQVFEMFTPEAILTLGQMIADSGSTKIKKQLLEVIGILAKKDLAPVVELITLSDADLVKDLVKIVSNVRGQKAQGILTRMLTHGSEEVRLEALEGLLARGFSDLERLYGMIDDSSNGIRELVLEYFGVSRNPQAEKLLLEYLAEQRFDASDPQHIMRVYRALGRCGSDRAVPFLSNILLKGKLSGLFDRTRNVQREGARQALEGLGTERAMALLKKAFP